MEIDREIVEKFITWIKLKIRIHISQKLIFPEERSIWWASLGQNIGIEINGKNENFERPVLILKKFSAEHILILPITSVYKTGSYFFNFRSLNGKINTINLIQIRSISRKRLIRYVGEMPTAVYNEVKNKLEKLLNS